MFKKATVRVLQAPERSIPVVSDRTPKVTYVVRFERYGSNTGYKHAEPYNQH